MTFRARRAAALALALAVTALTLNVLINGHRSHPAAADGPVDGPTVQVAPLYVPRPAANTLLAPNATATQVAAAFAAAFETFDTGRDTLAAFVARLPRLTAGAAAVLLTSLTANWAQWSAQHLASAALTPSTPSVTTAGPAGTQITVVANGQQTANGATTPVAEQLQLFLVQDHGRWQITAVSASAY